MWDTIKDSTLYQLMAPFVPGQSLFLFHLGSALLISIFVYFYFSHREARARPDGVSKGMFGYLFDRDIWFHKSARQDYLYFVVNSLVYSGIIAQFYISGSVFYGFFEIGLNTLLGAPETALFEASLTSVIVYTFVAALAMDLAIYITHYLQHKIATLWHFHSVHHSAEVLTVMTVYRQHPVDLFLTGTVVVALTQLGHAGYTYLTLSQPSVHGIMGVNSVIFVFFIFGYNLRHSHIWLSYPPWLSYILISPAQHQTHHSIEAKHFDRNFGFMFAFWDWMFGTLYVPRGYEKLEFGLSKHEPNPYGSVTELYLTPFKRAWQELASLAKGASAKSHSDTEGDQTFVTPENSKPQDPVERKTGLS